jgi:hypothetical protein
MISSEQPILARLRFTHGACPAILLHSTASTRTSLLAGLLGLRATTISIESRRG